MIGLTEDERRRHVYVLGPSEFEDFSNQQKQYMVVLLHYSFCAVILENSLPQFLGM